VTGTTFKRKLPSGRTDWCFQIDLGKDPETGKRQRIFKSGFATKKAADDERVRKLQELQDGSVVRPDPTTFGGFTAEWFTQHAEQNCSPKTVERYREMAKPLLAIFGSLPLGKITTLQLERLYGDLLKTGKKDREGNSIGGLSVKTVHNLHGMVHVMFQTALRWKLLKINPAEACVLPKLQRTEVQAPDQQQTDWLLMAAQGSWAYEILVIASATGARRGELLALTWPDVNFSAAVMTVRSSLEQTKEGLRVKCPKSGRTRRFALPALAIESLERVRTEQEHRRAMFGPDYRTDLNLVFCGPDGDYLRPDSVTKAARRLAKKAGLKGVSLHSLRHGHASILLSEGVPLPVVSKRLGHSNVHVTAQIYSHVLPADETAAADAWERTMRPVMEGPRVKQ
jgi:integrase